MQSITSKNSPRLLVFLACLACVSNAFAIGQAQYVENTAEPGSFPLFQNGVVADVYVDSNDLPGVVRAADDLQADISRVTGNTPKLTHDASGFANPVIILG